MVNTCAGCFLEFLLDWLGFLLPLVIGLASSPLMQLVQPAEVTPCSVLLSGHAPDCPVHRSRWACLRQFAWGVYLLRLLSLQLMSRGSDKSASVCCRCVHTHIKQMNWTRPIVCCAYLCRCVFWFFNFFPNATTYGVLKFCRNFLIHENAIICSCSTNCY